MKRLITFIFTLTIMGSTAHGQSKDIVGVAASNENFSTLVSLVQAAGLVDALKSEGPFTVFAPTNAAFAKLPASLVAKLKADKELLKSVLLYHVASGNFRAKTLSTFKQVDTLGGKAVRIKAMRNQIFLNNAQTRVIIADVGASNGTIHAIDTVLMPSDADRFARAVRQMPTIGEVVETNENFKTLKLALEATGLLDAVKTMKGITVFAPTDAAFAKIPKATLDALVANPEQLKSVLLYHVVKGEGSACKLLKKKRVQTLNGKPVLATYRGGKFFINKSRVINSDLRLSNGIVQVIDTVLIP